MATQITLSQGIKVLDDVTGQGGILINDNFTEINRVFESKVQQVFSVETNSSYTESTGTYIAGEALASGEAYTWISHIPYGVSGVNMTSYFYSSDADTGSLYIANKLGTGEASGAVAIGGSGYFSHTNTVTVTESGFLPVTVARRVGSYDGDFYLVGLSVESF